MLDQTDFFFVSIFINIFLTNLLYEYGINSPELKKVDHGILNLWKFFFFNVFILPNLFFEAINSSFKPFICEK